MNHEAEFQVAKIGETSHGRDEGFSRWAPVIGRAVSEAEIFDVGQGESELRDVGTHVEDSLDYGSRAGSKKIGRNRIADVCIRILFTHNRLDRGINLRIARIRGSVEFVRGADDLQCLEVVKFSQGDRCTDVADIVGIDLIKIHFEYFVCVGTRKSST